jgi:hypothetical protein
MKRFVVLGLAILSTAPAFAASDDFNRASLGKKWVVPFGTLTINNNQLQGTDTALGYFKKSQDDSALSVTVTLPDSSLQYGAVASGDIASGNNAFVKIQTSGSDSTFVSGAFYTGNNGSGDFFDLSAPVPSPAVLSVTFCGTMAEMKITSAVKTQKYAFDYGASFGTGGGLGTYGSVALDDYKSKAGRCKIDSDAVMVTPSAMKDPTLAK